MSADVTPPADLSEAGQILWAEAIAAAPHADATLVRGYVDAVLRYEAARKLYEGMQPVSKVGGSVVRNPVFDALRDAADQMRRFASDLGVTRQLGMFDDDPTGAASWIDRGAGGRATSKYTKLRVEAVLTGIRAGNSRTRAAIAAGLTKDTLRRWTERYPAFARALDAAEAEGVALLLEAVRRHAVSGAANTWQAAAWILERTHPDEFGQRNRLELSLQHREKVEAAARAAGIPPEDLFAEIGAFLEEARAQ